MLTRQILIFLYIRHLSSVLAIMEESNLDGHRRGLSTFPRSLAKAKEKDKTSGGLFRAGAGDFGAYGRGGVVIIVCL